MIDTHHSHKNGLGPRLDRSFFARSTIEVAQDLIGKIFVFHKFQGRIIETEAYGGSDDPASHAYGGPTPRSSIMFDEAGYTYVYFIYGMYHCLNFVTEKTGTAGAVLIRGLELIQPYPFLLQGPGKLCRELGITRTENKIDLVTSSSCYVCQSTEKSGLSYQITPRIGISKGQDKLWRFISTPKNLPRKKS